MQPRKKTGGRQAGTSNKVNAAVKDNILAVFNRLDGTAGMAEWAKENKTEFYKIYAKLLPTDITMDASVTVEIVRFSGK